MQASPRTTMRTPNLRASSSGSRHLTVSGPCARTRAGLRATKSPSGQATVEFALVLPLIVVVLFGIALFGLALNDWIDETQLVSEAARFAAVNSEHGTGHLNPEKEYEQFRKWITEQGDNKQVENAKAEICSPTSKFEDYVKVRLSYSYTWFGLGGSSGILSLFGGSQAAETPITSTATMRIEDPPEKPYPTTFASTKAC
jgi:TadE-like protein